ncbi:MAG: hypothetical protein DMG77_02465 [Acidobacteria bacterium]|nr:MAG: hypothetical protein DMG77_02465 [Acidobacteriota bacterium]
MIWTGESQRYTHPLPFSCGPLGLDFDYTFDSGDIVAKAAPGPVFRVLDQSALHGIAVDVAQLFDALGFGPYVEVVVASLPKPLAVSQMV